MTYVPEPVNELTLEWLLRELNRIRDEIEIAPLGSPAVSVTATATLKDIDQIVLADATGGAFTITLPKPTDKRVISLKKIDASANAVTIDGASSDTIDGAATQLLNSQYDSI